MNKFLQSWAKAVCEADVDSLMPLYAPNAFLKPTLSNNIRCTPEDIKLYFVGGDKYQDSGFLKQGISEVKFLEEQLCEGSDTFASVGSYQFNKNDGSDVKAHFTFVCKKANSGELQIILHHSSLFVD